MKQLLSAGLALAASLTLAAQNPIIRTSYTPDPAPYAHGNTLYLAVDHDEDDATYFKMKDWQLFSTEDMVNWTFLGTQVSTATFPWAFQGDRAWACQLVERGGKWYWYVCLTEAATRADALAVAVADDPQGPYVDAIGGPLATGFGFIDPSVFIDDDGSAWLIWGNKGCWYGRLGDDMVSFPEGWKEIPGWGDPACFGPESMKPDWSDGGKEKMMVGYEEGPWLYKRAGTYYLSYPAGGVPEHMAYSTAPSIHGPWTYRGRIMDEAENSFTIHGGNVDFLGHHYMFYHNGALPNGGGFHRSACVEEFEFGPDGSIPFIPFTEKGVEPLRTLNPYVMTQAETMASSFGLKTDREAGKRHWVTSVHNGDWLCVRNVDFGEQPAVLVSLEMLNFQRPGTVDFFLDEMGGRAIASVPVNGENMLVKAPVDARAKGVHDLYLLFRGGDGELFDLDWWVFNNHLNMPIIQTKYTADPAPYVHDGVVYLYTTHDEDGAKGFEMFDWLLYTSTDMVNWTDHGAVASLDDFAWYEGKNGAWAECVVERNGKWYMYCPIHGHGIGVLVSDSPYGPFKDPLGAPLVWQKEHWEDIDPSVFIDDDGQAYMYWGNPNVYWVKLNEDMISLASEIHKLDYKIDFYQEGPWFYKHDGHYYLAFASTCCPEGIGYAMADSPEGPWRSMGHIMDRTWRTRGNHPGIIEYKGQSYVFGLNYDLMHLETFQHAEQRSVSAAPMYYEADGSIRKVPYWLDNVLEQIEPFNPYRRVEAETMAWGYGLKTRKDAERGVVVNNIDAGEHLLVKGVDFGARGAKSLTACAQAPAGGCIEVRLDSPDGPLAGTLKLKPGTGWKQQTARLSGAKGVHDLYFVFIEGGFEWDWWTIK
jgi:beta-xylosidase